MFVSLLYFQNLLSYKCCLDFGQTAKHFEKHFDFLFQLLDARRTSGGSLNFGGMTCDYYTEEMNNLDLSPCRRSSVFKAFLSSECAPRISKDTNAQEGIGG
jgi:hypothetical protein